MMYEISVLQTDGTVEHLSTHTKPTLDELKVWVGGYIEHVRLNLTVEDGKFVQKDMIVNEEGLLDGLALNEQATKLYRETAFNNTKREAPGVIVGPALVFENFNLD
jgi:hypothetical protein